jgi:hypothetical protein
MRARLGGWASLLWGLGLVYHLGDREGAYLPGMLRYGRRGCRGGVPPLWELCEGNLEGSPLLGTLRG